MTDHIIELRNVTKLYNGIAALKDIHLKVKRGTVHALLGENGAGKSTIIKTLSGAIQPTGGTIVYNGTEYFGFEPKQALDLGIGVVYQEFNLVPHLTVADNVYLGNEHMRRGLLDRKTAREETRRVFSLLGMDIDPDTEIKNLSVAYQQLVEIAKAVSKNVKLLILDEPTATLSEQEVSSLLKLVKRLREQGITIIYISHRLEELFEIADYVTVLRDGEYVDELCIRDCTREMLITKMVGRELAKQYPQGNHTTDEVALRVRNLNNNKVKDVSFDLHVGEVLGFGGLVGAGRTEVVRALFGADYATGKIEVMGKPCLIRSPSDAIKNGIALLPESRKAQGLIMKQSIRENISLGWLKRLLKPWPALDLKRERRIAEDYRCQLSIKTPDIDLLVSSLSGGNQQKVVLAKWLLTNSRIIIFDEPTRGIDVGVKQEIYQIIKDLAAKGAAVIMISSEMPELIGVSDRILVMNEGRIVGQIDAHCCTQEEILSMATTTLNQSKEKNS